MDLLRLELEAGQKMVKILIRISTKFVDDRKGSRSWKFWRLRVTKHKHVCHFPDCPYLPWDYKRLWISKDKKWMLGWRVNR